MTSNFERIVLGAAGSLVGLSLALAVIYPPSAGITIPRAQLKDFATVRSNVDSGAKWRSGIFPVRAIGRGAESLTEDRNFPIEEYGYKAAKLSSAAALSKTFDRIGYDLDEVRAGGIAVPRLFLASLPIDMAEIRQTKKRKALFFKTVLPLILQTNNEIQKDRRRLYDLHLRLKGGERLPAVDRLWLIVLAERYKFEQVNVAELLKRVDIVPASLALAQAAEESGWGTSRFSREGNAIFGEWTFSSREGLVPLQRDSGKSHMVRSFKSLLDSVRAYVHNLNTHRAYKKFRALRNSMRNSGVPIRGRQLSKTLISYSERGLDYIKVLRTIMSVNKLDRLDNAKLSRPQIARQPVI